MPIARFQMPDGRIARFEVPDGTTPEQAQAMISAEIPKLSAEETSPAKIGKDAFPDTLRQVLTDTDWGTRNIAGAGTALSNVWEGLKQFVGKGDQPAIENNRIIREEAPVGAFAGDVAMTAAPFSLAGNSIKAAGAVGAGYGALQPVAGEQTAGNIAQGKALNAVVGYGSGAAGQYVANQATGWLGKKASDLALMKSQNATKDASLQEAVAAGYKVPPSMMPDSGVVARTAEGMSGKYKTNQLFGIRNQRVTNDLAKEALGIPKNEPLSVNAVEKVRESAYQPYREIAGLARRADDPVMGSSGFNPKATLEELKQSRADAKAWFESYNRSANPEQLATAKAYQAKADALESSIEDYAKSLGRNDLVNDLVNARKLIAKTYTVERAMKKGSGDVDATVLGRLFEKGKPLSDGLDKAGKFGATFKDVAGVPKSGNANPFTALDFMQMSGVGPLGMIAAGNPIGLLSAGALPAARVASRYGLLSDTAQRAIANPSYNVPIAARMTGGLLNYAPIGGTALALDAFN